MALFGEITSRAVSSGTTSADFQRKRTTVAETNVSNPWGCRTLDVAKNEQRQERMQKALQSYNFALELDA